jgi:hypothetical protein
LGKLHDDVADALAMAVALARVGSFKPAMTAVASQPDWYSNRTRGRMSQAAEQMVSRERAQEAEPMAHGERRSLWASRW